MGRQVLTTGRRAGTTAAMVAGLGLLASACGGGGGGGTGGALGKRTVTKLSVLQAGAGASVPVDAAPSPDGSTVYFTGTGFNGQGVFRMGTTGGDTTAVAVGAPFVHPTGIAIATDGSHAYVADAEATSSTGGKGAIFSVALSGGASTPTVVPGTEGSAARGLEIVRQSGQDVIYYTGRGSDGLGGVFKIAAAGGTSSTVAKGAPLTDPDAVTVAKNGTVYLTDRGPAGKKPNGGVYRVTGAGILRIADLRAPDFAGITLSLDESVVLVSALDPKHATDQVTLIDTTSLKTGVFNKTIKANRHGGGLHRAANADVFSWADVQRPGRNNTVPIYVFTG